MALVAQARYQQPFAWRLLRLVVLAARRRAEAQVVAGELAVLGGWAVLEAIRLQVAVAAVVSVAPVVLILPAAVAAAEVVACTLAVGRQAAAVAAEVGAGAVGLGNHHWPLSAGLVGQARFQGGCRPMEQ